MKQFLFPALMLILWANCASHSVSKFPATPTLNTSTPENSTAVSQGNSSETSNEVMSEKEVPATFKGIDFKHLSYPTSFRKKYIPLHDGTYEIPGGTGGETFELEGVDYVDITGDGKKDAVVQLFWLSCGVSCDGGSHLFYVYSILRGQLKLMSRIETGSLGYTCGLRSFVVQQSEHRGRGVQTLLPQWCDPQESLRWRWPKRQVRSR
jgi:hypothetical protein